jgi:hypothetical protein
MYRLTSVLELHGESYILLQGQKMAFHGQILIEYSIGQTSHTIIIFQDFVFFWKDGGLLDNLLQDDELK